MTVELLRCRIAATWLVVVLALGGMLLGCGDDEDTSSQSSATASDGQPADDGGEIRQLYRDFVNALYNGPPKAICDRLTPRAQRESQPSGGSCEQLYAQSLQASSTGTATYPKPVILKVEVKGDVAIARIKTPGSTGGIAPGVGGFSRVRFERLDGEWKVDGDIDTGPL
jgi:hypothetical protein